MLDTNEIFVGAQSLAPSVRLKIISIALFMKWYKRYPSTNCLEFLYLLSLSNFSENIDSDREIDRTEV